MFSLITAIGRALFSGGAVRTVTVAAGAATAALVVGDQLADAAGEIVGRDMHKKRDPVGYEEFIKNRPSYGQQALHNFGMTFVRIGQGIKRLFLAPFRWFNNWRLRRREQHFAAATEAHPEFIGMSWATVPDGLQREYTHWDQLAKKVQRLTERQEWLAKMWGPDHHLPGWAYWVSENELTRRSANEDALRTMYSEVLFDIKNRSRVSVDLSTPEKCQDTGQQMYKRAATRGLPPLELLKVRRDVLLHWLEHHYDISEDQWTQVAKGWDDAAVTMAEEAVSSQDGHKPSAGKE